MTKYSPEQIAALAHSAGFTGKEQIVTATAIALAESGGNQDAVHHNSDAHKTNDYGIWQINDYYHPDKIALARSSAQGNAQAAYKVWAEKHAFTPWATYNSKSYLAHLPAAEKAYATIGKDTSIEAGLKDGGKAADSGGGGSIFNVGGSITSAVNSLNRSIFGVAVNAGVFLAALVILVLGVLLLARKPIGAGVRTVAGVKRKGVTAVL